LAQVPEADASLVVTVTLSCPVDVPVTVHVQTGSSFQTPAATAGDDYTAINGAEGNVQIPANQTSGTINLALSPDNKVEGDEWFHLAVDQIVQAFSRQVEIGVDSQRHVKIEDDDSASVALGSDLEVTEPSSGFVYAIFTITLSGDPVAVPVTIHVATNYQLPGGPGYATPGTNGDFLEASELITFSPGQTTKTFSVRVYHDNVEDEGDEEFWVEMSIRTAPYPQVANGNSIATCIIHD
jgi:hypothetical protein